MTDADRKELFELSAAKLRAADRATDPDERSALLKQANSAARLAEEDTNGR